MITAADQGAMSDASVTVARDADGMVAVLTAEFPRHGGEYVFLPGGRREPVRHRRNVRVASCVRKPASPPGRGGPSARTPSS
ncbi:hypothetical protein [Streptomyces sp. GESEQ-4]|uniref:hypothetical protein n=1 Tax=Streptomyces sp. GESEQ-4 TaxID=2812655 RepID=UPI0035A960B9